MPVGKMGQIWVVVDEDEKRGLTELVARDEGTAHFSRADLGHVEDDGGGDEADTKTGNETASDDEAETGRSGLENASNNVNEAARNDGGSATNPVGEITGNQRACRGVLSKRYGWIWVRAHQRRCPRKEWT